MANEQTKLIDWAKQIQGRVGNTCVKCGSDKGGVLCNTCHARFHSIYGREGNTAEQFDEFLKTDYYNKGSVHVRMYSMPVQEGLLNGLSGEACKVYLVLLSHIDKDYRCYPSQSHIAKLTGVSRTTVNRRLQELCDYRWQGEPLVTKIINKHRGAFTNNVYYINPAFVEIY